MPGDPSSFLPKTLGYRVLTAVNTFPFTLPSSISAIFSTVDKELPPEIWLLPFISEFSTIIHDVQSTGRLTASRL